MNWRKERKPLEERAAERIEKALAAIRPGFGPYYTNRAKRREQLRGRR